MTDSIHFSCQPAFTQKAISTVYIELLQSDDRLNRRPAYQRHLAWKLDQKSKLIDTIMTNCPMPIFLLYMYDKDDEYECIDGQNRLTTIKEYIEQDPTVGTPFAWIVETEAGEDYVYYDNETTRAKMEAYCQVQNKKRRRGVQRNHRLMSQQELKKFKKYEVVLSQIKEKLSFEQRQEIFMRWQNGTTISQCDAFKNEPYPFCVYAISNSVDRGLTDQLSQILKSDRRNWLWDTYRLMNAFNKDSLEQIMLSTIQARSLIEKETEPYTNYKELQTKLEKMLVKLKPLESLKDSVYISFLLGYIYLWRKVPQNVRVIAEKSEFLLEFAKQSFNNDDCSHTTLNNGPQIKAFIRAFPVFERDFYMTIDKFAPQASESAEQAKKKTNIPDNVKTEVWDAYIGVQVGEAPCYCCGVQRISQRKFHAGHVVPESHGGLAERKNLRPICAGCNLSMGTQNMFTYMSKHYPQRFKEFQEKDIE